MGGIESQLYSFLTSALVSGQLHAPTPLPSAPIQREAGWTPELVWTFWRREKSHILARIRTPDRPAHSL